MAVFRRGGFPRRQEDPLIQQLLEQARREAAQSSAIGSPSMYKAAAGGGIGPVAGVLTAQVLGGVRAGNAVRNAENRLARQDEFATKVSEIQGAIDAGPSEELIPGQITVSPENQIESFRGVPYLPEPVTVGEPTEDRNMLGKVADALTGRERLGQETLSRNPQTALGQALRGADIDELQYYDAIEDRNLRRRAEAERLLPAIKEKIGFNAEGKETPYYEITQNNKTIYSLSDTELIPIQGKVFTTKPKEEDLKQIRYNAKLQELRAKNDKKTDKDKRPDYELQGEAARLADIKLTSDVPPIDSKIVEGYIKPDMSNENINMPSIDLEKSSMGDLEGWVKWAANSTIGFIKGGKVPFSDEQQAANNLNQMVNELRIPLIKEISPKGSNFTLKEVAKLLPNSGLSDSQNYSRMKNVITLYNLKLEDADFIIKGNNAINVYGDEKIALEKRTDAIGMKKRIGILIPVLEKSINEYEKSQGISQGISNMGNNKFEYIEKLSDEELMNRLTQ